MSQMSLCIWLFSFPKGGTIIDFLWEQITDWLKEVLVSGIISNLTGMFDSTNEQIGNIVGEVGLTPQAWNSGIFNMIQRAAPGNHSAEHDTQHDTPAKEAPLSNQ